MSEIEPRKRTKGEIAPRHIPHEVVPVPIGEARDFVRDALRGGSSVVNAYRQFAAGWAYFEPHLTFTEVDEAHTRVEIDMVGLFAGAETLLYPRRRAAIDRFFVAMNDELDRRERWRPRKLGELHPDAATSPPSIDG